MKSFAFLLILALPAVGALAAACNGDGGEGLTLEEYFQRLDTIFEDAEARFDAVGDPQATIEDPEATLDEKSAAVRGFFNALLAVAADIIDELEALDAPAEAQDAHADFLAFFRDFLQAGEDIAGKVEDVESDEEFEALGEEFFAATEGFTDACLALQRVADDNNIAVDLECEEEQELEKYYQQLQSLNDGTDAKFAELETRYPLAFQDPAQTRDAFNAAVHIFEGFIQGLKDIDAPSDVDDEHREAIAAAEGALEVQQEIADRLAAPQTSSELEELLVELETEPRFATAFDRFNAACLALQAIADDNNIAVDLGC